MNPMTFLFIQITSLPILGVLVGNVFFSTDLAGQMVYIFGFTLMVLGTHGMAWVLSLSKEVQK